MANSQVLMISCDCGRRSIGNTRANRSGSVPQRPAICGVSDEVAQVSITSGSRDEPAGHAALRLVVPGRGVGGRVDRQRVLRRGTIGAS